MSNFDRLSVDNNNKENLTVSVVEPKKKETNLPTKKPTIFSVIMASIKQDKTYLEKANQFKPLPIFKYTFLTFFSLVLLAILILVISITTLPVKTIPLLLLCLPSAMIALIIVFYSELNQYSKLNTFYVFFAFLTGILIYFIIDFLSTLVYRFISIQVFNQIAQPILYSLFTFFFSFVLCNLFKTTKMGECFVVAVSISLGFYFITELTGAFSRLFVLDGTINTGSYIAPPGSGVIINNSEYLKNNLNSMLNSWAYNYLALPYLYACWATVIGFLVSFAAENKIKKREAPKSIYLLLMLVILLNAIAFMDTAMGYLSLILVIASVVGSSLLAIVFLNIYLQED